MNTPDEITLRAAARWAARTAVREQHRQQLREAGVFGANDPARLVKHLIRRAVHLQPGGAFGERIMGIRNLRAEFEVPADARRVGASVGRIVTRPQPGLSTEAQGTGFLISPRLLMTNNHVIGSDTDARDYAVQFGYAKTAPNRTANGSIYLLEPARFFLTSRELDMTIVAVAAKADTGEAVSALPWNVLRRAIGKVLIGQDMNVIQHPDGKPRQYALEQNKLVDILQDHLHYEADTEPGSSGSPVFSDAWEVVALHHAGVPRMNEAGHILDRFGAVAAPGTADEDIDWIANEGVRISKILAYLDQLRVDPSAQALLDEVLSAEQRLPFEHNLPSFEKPLPMNIQTRERGMNTFNFYGQTTVYVGAAVAGSEFAGSAASDALDSALPPVGGVASDDAAHLREARERRHPSANYTERSGYDPQFLRIAVPLPTLPRHLLNHAAKKTTDDNRDAFVLDYEHFSLVMNARRRLAYYTAVNIDGQAAQSLARQDDAWYYDPRIPVEAQAGEFLYRSNPLDRGHLVRRLDPVWGGRAGIANDDTFHWTNCSPQHERLNQRTWLDLEDFLLKNAKNTHQRLTVFTGPIFDEDDPVYRATGVKIPLRFFKVAAMLASDEQLLAAAFIQSQDHLVGERLGERVFDDFDFLAINRRVDQVSVREVEDLIGFSFGNLRNVDAMRTQQEALSSRVRIDSVNDIRLDRAAT